MKFKRVILKFKRPLTQVEQNNLVAYYKGNAQLTVEQLAIQQKKLAREAAFAHFGSLRAPLDAAKTRIEGMITPYEKDGRMTTYFEQLFGLEYEPKEPTVYYFKYPHFNALFGVDISEQLKKARINIKFSDEQFIKGLCKEAKIERTIESIQIEDIESE